MDKVKWVCDRFTKCDSGLTLNPLMHIFLFITLVFSVAFLFFGHTVSVQSLVLFQETLMIDKGFVNIWGLIGLGVVTLHTLGFLIRGRWGVRMMQVCIFGGAYMWIWAAVIYLAGGFYFQFLLSAVPSLAFWAWYAWQWRRRYNNKRVAFV